MVWASRLLQAHQLVLHLGADQRVEGGERLVHEQDRRLGRQRPGEPDALLHAARELVRVAVGHGLQAHRFQRLQGPLALLRTAAPGYLQPEGGVLGHRPVGEQGEGLEDHAHLCAAHAR